MCNVRMDLKDDRNLDLAIYSLVLAKKDEFSPLELVQGVKKYQDIDENYLMTKVNSLLKRWVKIGIVQEHLDTFSTM